MAIRIYPKKHFQKARAGNGAEILKKLEGYLKNSSGKPIQILCGFWKDQAEAITYQELREAIKEGLLTKAIFQEWSKDYSFLVHNQLSFLWKDALTAGSMSQPITVGLASYTFNVETPAIMAWIAEHSAEFVTASVIEQKEAIKALLARSVIEHHSVDELAKFIRPCIGLTKPQAKANLRYYDSIVKTLKEQHPRMKQDSIQRKAREAAAKYAEKQHRQRALTIAMTEMASAYNKGADEGIRQAQNQNLIGKVMKRWCTSGDDAVCGQCSELDGLEIEMDSTFPFKGRWHTGDDLTPPAHPRCACAVEYIEIEPVRTDNVAQEIKEVSNGAEDVETNMQKLGEIEIDKVDEALEYYENLFRDDIVENVLVIDKYGRVYYAKGDSSGVDIGKIDLTGAYITHNHPASNGILSFGKDDFDFLRNHQDIAGLRCVNEEYNYFVSVLKDMSEVIYNNIYKEAFLYYEEEEFEVQHKTMEILKREGYVNYVRQKIDKGTER